MTLAERWIEKVKLEGLKEVVRRMLLANISEPLIQTATGFSLREISTVRKELSH